MPAHPIHNLKMKDLRISQHNIRGLEANKLQVINHLDYNNIHIFMASETFQKSRDNFFFKNYSFVDSQRDDGYGGAAIFFKNNITFEAITLPDFALISAVAAKTTNLPLNLTLLSVYVPAKKKELPEWVIRQDLLELAKFARTLKDCLVGGDFNAFNPAWGSSYSDMRGILLYDEMEDLCLLNDGSPTRIPSPKTKANPLDLTWVSSSILERIEWEVTTENLGSDHLIIRIEISLAMNTEEIKVKAKVDDDEFKKGIEELDLDGIENLADFIEEIDKLRTKATKKPQTMKNPKFVPKSYWTEEINRMHKLKKSALVRYFRHMSTKDWVEFKVLNARFKRALKKGRTEAWRAWAESLSPNSSARDIFRNFKRLNNYRVPNQPNFMFQNSGMVREFLDGLCKVGKTSSEFDVDGSNTEDPFSMDELCFVLGQKVDSAPGTDGIRYSDISKFPVKVKENFLELVNALWASQDVPESMKKILMVMIPKPGRDLKLLNSHRPIALLSVYLKVINSMIKVRLEKLIQDKKLLN